MHFAPLLPLLLTEAEVDRICRDAVRILTEIGVACAHAPTGAELQATTGTQCRNGRLYFAASELEACLAALRAAACAPAPAPPAASFALGGQWNCLNLCEPLTQVVRPATEPDVIAMARLAEALGKRGGPVPLAPAYVPPGRRTLEAERLALLYTRHCGGLLTATNRREIQFLAAMNQAAGRRYQLGIEGLISPLRINPECMRVFFENRDDPDLDLVCMAAIPMAGASTPLVFPAALAQSVAENLAHHFVMYHLSHGRCAPGFGLRVEPFDLRDGNIAIGTPEWCLYYHLIVSFLTSFAGGRRPGGGMFRSNAPVPDAQAQTQRTACVLWQALCGARHFGAVGQLCMDEVFSPVQAIYDREIVRYVERVIAGWGPLWDEGADTVAQVQEGLAAGTFLVADRTVANCHQFLCSDFFSARPLGSWRAAGEPTKEAWAWQEAQELIAAANYELPADARRAVEQVYRQAVRNSAAGAS